MLQERSTVLRYEANVRGISRLAGAASQSVLGLLSYVLAEVKAVQKNTLRSHGTLSQLLIEQYTTAKSNSIVCPYTQFTKTMDM